MRRGQGRGQPPEVPLGGERTHSEHPGTDAAALGLEICDPLENFQRFSCMLFFIFRALDTYWEFTKKTRQDPRLSVIPHRTFIPNGLPNILELILGNALSIHTLKSLKCNRRDNFSSNLKHYLLKQ